MSESSVLLRILVFAVLELYIGRASPRGPCLAIQLYGAIQRCTTRISARPVYNILYNTPRGERARRAHRVAGVRARVRPGKPERIVRTVLRYCENTSRG